MPILDSDFDDGANDIDEQRKCPYCNGLLRFSKKPSILYECIECEYKDYQWKNHKMPVANTEITYPIKLEFSPTDETLFKKLLIKTKRAKRTFYDKDGNAVYTNFWNIRNFTVDSNLRGNIDSSQVYRDAPQKGIAKIRFEIEGYKDEVNMLAKPKPIVVLHKKAKPTTNTSKEQEKSVFMSNENSVAKNEEQMKMERTLKDCCISIFEAVSNIENGKYVMPAFQRQYVWNMEQIEKLWDSILLDYPISTFLFWHIDEQNITSDTYFCKFLKSATFNFQKKSATPNYELSGIKNTKITDTAILDGQQRLTSLYLSLLCDNIYIKGKHERGEGGRLAKLLIELDKSKIEDVEGEFNTKQYDIAFTENLLRSSSTKFEFRKLEKDERFRNESTRQEAIDDAIKSVPIQSKEYARDLLNNLCRKVFDDKRIRFTEIHGINQDDALEMFVRFNSGGTPLKKSEITMSILEAYWPSVRNVFGTLLENSTYNDFGTDFIVRTALMLYGDVVKSNLNKKTADELKNNWDYFTEVLQKLDGLLKSMNIATEHFSSSWNILLPVIYFIYNNPDYEDEKDAIKAYLIRGTVFTYFKSGTTGKLSVMRNKIIECDNRITMQMLDNMNEFRVTDARVDDLLNLEYGSKVVDEILYYLSLDWYKDNIKYATDHLHPRSKFDNKPLSIDMTKWNQLRANKDRLPNLELLEGRANESKQDMRLVDYYNDMNCEQQQKFRTQALIPDDVSLEIDDFEEFYESRKKLLTQKITEMLG